MRTIQNKRRGFPVTLTITDSQYHLLQIALETQFGQETESRWRKQYITLKERISSQFIKQCLKIVESKKPYPTDPVQVKRAKHEAAKGRGW